MQNGNAKAIDNRMRKEMLNAMQFLNLAYARAELAAWTGEFSQERHTQPLATQIRRRSRSSQTSSKLLQTR